MTICRTTEFGGSAGASARPADMTRIDSPFPGGALLPPVPARPGLPAMSARPGYRVPSPRRAQPPDYELLVRVRDGLMRL
jgi:hypothetical protein